ncbi:tetratricopeptide repeat protein [Kaarinaea lacus]
MLLTLPSVAHSHRTVIDNTNETSGTDQPLRVAANEIQEAAPMPTAVIWYLEMAEQGDKDAQYNLGSIYETGFGVAVNLKEAVKWYAKAAEQGHTVAQLKLGMLHYVGKDELHSTIKGNKWIRESAKAGNTLGKLLQDEVLAHEIEKDIDPKDLITKTLKALEKGQINAEETLRLELQKIQRARKSAPKKERFAGDVTGSAAKPGTVKSEVPDFLKENPQKLAVTLDNLPVIQKFAKDGNADAQYQLARLYELGDKVEHSDEEAFKWYLAAAEQGQKDAQYRLGLAYLYGIGTPASLASAGTYLNKAALQKQPAATLLLSHISSRKNGTIDKPHSVMLTWYLEQSLSGDGNAMMGLGHMYETGWGIAQDINAAKRWYAKARAAGTKGAARRLRQMKAEVAGGAEASVEKVTQPVSTQPAIHREPRTPGQNAAPVAPEESGGVLSRLQPYYKPVGLVVLGIVMGAIVFRLLRGGGASRDSVF